MELAPGLRRIGNDIVAAHLLVTDDGITLIDAGLPGHFVDLERELAAIGRPLHDIRGVVLTHGDGDHVGFAERLSTRLGIPVFVGEADADRAKGAKPPATPKNAWRLGPTLGFAAYGLRKGMARPVPLGDVVPVHDGQELDLPGRPRVLAMPGHSPGSIAVLVPSVRAVFVGDGLTTRHVLTGVVGPQPAPFTDDQSTAAVSVDVLRDLPVDWVIPGHGAPWHGSPSELVDAYHRAESH